MWRRFVLALLICLVVAHVTSAQKAGRKGPPQKAAKAKTPPPTQAPEPMPTGKAPVVGAPRECLFPADTARCNRPVRMFFFNENTGKCQPFWFGGCYRNSNRFTTMQACDQHCTCQLAFSEGGGACELEQTRYRYDSASRTCMPFMYMGCGGNGNNFKTQGECLQQCYSPFEREAGEVEAIPGVAPGPGGFGGPALYPATPAPSYGPTGGGFGGGPTGGYGMGTTVGYGGGGGYSGGGGYGGGGYNNNGGYNNAGNNNGGYSNWGGGYTNGYSSGGGYGGGGYNNGGGGYNNGGGGYNNGGSGYNNGGGGYNNGGGYSASGGYSGGYSGGSGYVGSSGGGSGYNGGYTSGGYNGGQQYGASGYSGGYPSGYSGGNGGGYGGGNNGGYGGGNNAYPNPPNNQYNQQPQTGYRG